MRLESFKARWIGKGNTRLKTDRSSSIDSEEESRIRIDDPSLRLDLMESPSPNSDTTELNFNDFTDPKRENRLKLDTNMNTHVSLDANGGNQNSPNV